MKRRFYLSFKIFLIVFVGFIIVLFFIYNREVQVHIKNAILTNRLTDVVNREGIVTEFPKSTGVNDLQFQKYIDDTISSDDEAYTVILDKNFNVVYQRSDHVNDRSMLLLFGEQNCKVKINQLTIQQRKNIVDALQKMDLEDLIEVGGSKTLSNLRVLAADGTEQRLPDNEQTIEIEPNYLKIGDTVIFGTKDKDAITNLTFQYYADDTYMIQDTWLFADDSYYRNVINKKEEIEKNIPELLQEMQKYAHELQSTDVHYEDYTALHGKHYRWIMIPLIKTDLTRDIYNQEIQGYYVKIKYFSTIEKMASSEYVHDNIGTYALSLTIILIISVLCSYMIVKPIKKIEKAAKQIADNDFDVKLNIHSRDELGTLSNSINTMSINLKDTIDKLKEEIEQVKRLESTRKEFIANFTHEIKTPLAIINGYSELIEETKDKQEIEKYIVIIDEATQKINHLVQAMLNLSKLESNLVTLKMESMELEDIATKVIDSYEVLLKEKEVKIELHSTNPTIQGDKEQLETVITNFMSNAMYHVNMGGKIYIIIDKHMFSIENEGLPIEQERLQTIWETFQTGNKQGTGLGLAICKSILELHQYQYGVENTNKGVKFYFKY